MYNLKISLKRKYDLCEFCMEFEMKNNILIFGLLVLNTIS